MGGAMGGLGGGKAAGVRGVPQPGDDPSTYLLREILEQQRRKRDALKMNDKPLTNSPDIPSYGFEKEYNASDYDTGPAGDIEEWKSQAPEYESTRSEERARTSPGSYKGDRAEYFRDETDRSRRDNMMIGDKRNRRGRRGRKGKSGAASSDRTNYYDEYAEGTGVHT